MLTDPQLRTLLEPYVTGLQDDTVARLNTYIELVLRWNIRTNLTAVRSADQLAQRQVGESLFAAQFLEGVNTLLDFGSGAGFPGIPLALTLPQVHVVLAESQGKKAAFLREAVRSLEVPVEVCGNRVEAMPVERNFDAVVMRAVDRTSLMVPAAEARVSQEGLLFRYLSSSEAVVPNGWKLVRDVQVPLSDGRLAAWKREL